MFDRLPNEINDIIWNMYWTDVYSNKVINTFKIIEKLEIDIRFFYERNPVPISYSPYYKQRTLYYFKIFNDKLKNISNNNQKMLKNHKLFKYICNIEECKYIIGRVNDDYKYICIILLTIGCPSRRFYVLDFFQKLY